MKSVLKLFVILSFISCSSDARTSESKSETMVQNIDKQEDAFKDTIKLEFKIVNMLPIGWGTFYNINIVNNQGISKSILNDTLRLYIGVGYNSGKKLDLHFLKKDKVYRATFLNSHKKPETSYMPPGNTGFLDNNNEIWHLIDISDTEMTQKITVIGMALNAKLGAVVRGENDEYYIEGLEEWPDEVHQKKVKVTGYVTSEYHDPKNLVTKEGLHKTGMSGEKRSLQDAIWELID